MRLRSDFRDYYDWAFSGSGDEFVRIAANSGPSKREQFRLLRDAGYKTPPVGSFDDLREVDEWDEGRIRYVVAYTDEAAHVGEGKELWSINRFRSNPHIGGVDRHAEQRRTFCSSFVEGQRGVSWRRLQIGPHVFWIEYTSSEDWRSNCGEGDIELLEAELNAGYHPTIRLPLFAIDFVHGRKDMYAVDFNVAPGVSGCGVQRLLPAADAVAAIEEAHRTFSAEETETPRSGHPSPTTVVVKRN